MSSLIAYKVAINRKKPDIEDMKKDFIMLLGATLCPAMVSSAKVAPVSY
jgi:hypothetical protein